MSIPGVDGVAGAAMAAALVAVLSVCTVEDVRRRIVPNRAVAAGAAFALAAIWIADPVLLPVRLLASLGAGAFFLAPALMRPGSIGIGDAKLAAMAALYLGPEIADAILIAFLAGTAAGALLFARHGPAALKMTIPFVPYIALGVVVATAHPG